MTKEQIEKTINESLILVGYFSHESCNVCKVLRPKVKALAESFEKVDFLYINTHEQPEMSGQYLIFAVPTIVVFIAGKESKRFSRHFGLDEVEALLARYSEMAA
ncbi:MAG TPA: thioredoxin [Calditrichaeota bacterium]|nr:thioredoxin [Calditrichota bacterium]